MEKGGFVYILTNKHNTVMYIGVSSNIDKRLWEHSNKVTDSSSCMNNLNKLVYYEKFESIQDAIRREKQLKNWRRDWKINLIKELNPNFEDLHNHGGDPETSSG